MSYMPKINTARLNKLLVFFYFIFLDILCSSMDSNNNGRPKVSIHLFYFSFAVIY